MAVLLFAVVSAERHIEIIVVILGRRCIRSDVGNSKICDHPIVWSAHAIADLCRGCIIAVATGSTTNEVVYVRRVVRRGCVWSLSSKVRPDADPIGDVDV